MFDFHYATAGQKKDILCVVLTGELNEQSCDYLLACIEEQIHLGHTRVVLDCGRLTEISSLGLAMLVRVNARMRRVGGEAKLAAVPSLVAQVIRLVHLHHLFQMYPTAAEAVTAHERQTG